MNDIDLTRPSRIAATVCAAVMVLGFNTTEAVRGFQSGGQMENHRVELQRDLQALETLRTSRNLSAIAATIDRDSTKWKQTDSSSFVAYMFGACSLLSSYDLGNFPRQAEMVNRYTISTLTSAKLSLREEAQFIQFLTQDPPDLDADAWRKLRQQKALLWLDLWQRIAQRIEPGFDFNDVPLLNVSPPSETGLPAGVMPDAIKDPKLRGQYQKAIADNRAKAERYNEQHWLRQNSEALFAAAEGYLVSAYSKPPADVAELTRFLEQYVKGNPAVSRILAKIK